MHGVFPDRLDQQQVVNAILDSLRVVFGGGFVQIVVTRAAPVINIRVGMAFPLPVIVALDTPNRFFFELVHVQHQKRHG